MRGLPTEYMALAPAEGRATLAVNVDRTSAAVDQRLVPDGSVPSNDSQAVFMKSPDFQRPLSRSAAPADSNIVLTLGKGR